jgi:MmyB-like transcription regulator ligand binding domain/Helix-turn-helix domain
MAGTIDTRSELAAFLRTRRERLAPDEFDLPERRRVRRTPGLRREEVAELAGVSVDYVVRLEQGRGLRPSADVLDALAGALRLTEDERAYLFDLAQQRPVARQPIDDSAAPSDTTGVSHAGSRAGSHVESLRRLVDDLSPLPCMLLNHRLDVVAWNAEMAGLTVDFGAVPEHQRNALWVCLLHPSLRTFYRNRERVIREGIADLRAAWATRPDDAGLSRLVADLSSRSEEFTRLWALRDVRVNGRGRKELLHPTVGLLTIEFEVLVPLQDPDHRLVVYRATDAVSQAALDAIAHEAADVAADRRNLGAP